MVMKRVKCSLPRCMKRRDELDIDFENCKKVMSSNLPLLFANGRPRSLETISQPELEEFVPFMVRCSLGQFILKNPKKINDCPAPEWWPQGLCFKFPLVEQSGWINRLVMLKSLVCRCYTYYSCEFLLKFSSELADMPPSHLRFEKNQDDTTSIFDASGSLLVKCRDENLNYDMHKNPRRYLSPAHTVVPASRNAGKRKTSVEQSEEPVSAKRRLRLFNDFPQEKAEPTTYNQEQFMEKFQLIPLGKEIPNDTTIRLDKKKRLAKSFSILSISCGRGQELLAKNRHSFNLESSLNRIERFCGLNGEEEEESNQVYTRAAATFSAMYRKDDENQPEKNQIAEFEEKDDKWYHSYKWAHKTKNPVYPYRGPSVKPCTVMLSKLSEDELDLYSSKIKTTDELCSNSNNLAICNCQLISNNHKKPIKTKGVKHRNKKYSTACTCGVHFLFLRKKSTLNVNIEMNNKEKCASYKQDEYSVNSQKKGTNGSFNACASGDTDISCLHTTDQSQKHGFSRRPLAVVPPMPAALGRPVAADPSLATQAPRPLTASTTPTKENLSRSIINAVEWYTKDDGTSPDEIRENAEEIRTIDPSQENIKPTTELSLPNFAKPIDYFQQNLNVAEFDFCFKRPGDNSSKLTTRRGEKLYSQYFGREPCPSCFQGRNYLCVYEFVRQAKLAGLALQENKKHLQSWYVSFLTSVNKGRNGSTV